MQQTSLVIAQLITAPWLQDCSITVDTLSTSQSTTKTIFTVLPLPVKLQWSRTSVLCPNYLFCPQYHIHYSSCVVITVVKYSLIMGIRAKLQPPPACFCAVMSLRWRGWIKEALSKQKRKSSPQSRTTRYFHPGLVPVYSCVVSQRQIWRRLIWGATMVSALSGVWHCSRVAPLKSANEAVLIHFNDVHFWQRRIHLGREDKHKAIPRGQSRWV